MRTPGDNGIETSAVIKCNQEFAEKHDLMVVKVLVDLSKELIPL